MTVSTAESDVLNIALNRSNGVALVLEPRERRVLFHSYYSQVFFWLEEVGPVRALCRGQIDLFKSYLYSIGKNSFKKQQQKM